MEMDVIPELLDLKTSHEVDVGLLVDFSSWVLKSGVNYTENIDKCKRIVINCGVKTIKEYLLKIIELDKEKILFPVVPEYLTYKELVEIVLSIYLDTFCAYLFMCDSFLEEDHIVKRQNQELTMAQQSILIQLETMREKYKYWTPIKMWVNDSKTNETNDFNPYEQDPNILPQIPIDDEDDGDNQDI